jgi:hypothetical protein
MQLSLTPELSEAAGSARDDYADDPEAPKLSAFAGDESDDAR